MSGCMREKVIFMPEQNWQGVGVRKAGLQAGVGCGRTCVVRSEQGWQMMEEAVKRGLAWTSPTWAAGVSCHRLPGPS